MPKSSKHYSPSSALHAGAAVASDRGESTIQSCWQPWARGVMERLARGTPAPLDQYWAKPEMLMVPAGVYPDQWQRDLLRSNAAEILVLCSRQSGKSTTAAGLALRKALLEPPADVLIISRALRQSLELLRKVKQVYRALRGDVEEKKRNKRWRPRPLEDETKWYDEMLGKSGWDGAALLSDPGSEAVSDNALSMELANGSRIISLPGSADTIVGYSAISLLIIDEASRVPDQVYYSVRPMLAVSRGQLVCLSTPFGKRGFFWEEWDAHVRNNGSRWETYQVRATDCPRISPAFLEAERQSVGERWYRQEYLCSFEDTVDAVFSYDVIHRAVKPDIEVLF